MFLDGDSAATPSPGRRVGPRPDRDNAGTLSYGRPRGRLLYAIAFFPLLETFSLSLGRSTIDRLREIIDTVHRYSADLRPGRVCATHIW